MPDPLLPDSGIIDVHVHTYPTHETGTRAQGGRGRSGAAGTAGEFRELMDRGIRRAVLVNITPVTEMVVAANRRGDASPNGLVLARMVRRNRWTLAAAREDPRFVASVNVDPNLMDENTLLEELNTAFSDGARGITLHPANQSFYPNDKRLWPAYELAQRLGMIVFAQSGYGVLEGTDDFGRPIKFEDPLGDFPRLTFVLGHLGWKYWDEPPVLASRFSNVHFDTSYVVSADIEPPPLSGDEATSLIRAVGTDRVLFGSDWPWSHPLRDAATIMRLGLSTKEQQRILFGNAAALLGDS